MANLRNSIMTQILDYLEYGEFCLEDFDINFPNESSVLAQIIFKSLPKYSFVLDETYSGGGMGAAMMAMGKGNSKKILRTIEKPGEYKNNETKTHDSIDSAIRRISDWVINIREDLIHSKVSVRHEIDELTKAFQSSIDEKIPDQEAYFEEDEENNIRDKLDELQARVSELESKFDISKEDTKKINKIIEKSKSDLSVYPKGVWYKTVGTKLLKSIKDVFKTKEGRELLADVAKKLLE